jgi:hypothetical protein
MPFTLDGVPIELTAHGKRIPEWQLDDLGLVGSLQASPVKSDEPKEEITLVPMGAARLRISSFPVIGEGDDAHRWPAPPKPLYRASASHCFEGDTVRALCDRRLPKHSHDQNLPRMTWWPRKGSAEWVQYDLDIPREISGVSVYWFDDTSTGGGCGLPKSWRLLYRDPDGQWKPIPGTDDLEVVRDQLHRQDFPPMVVDSLRLEVRLQDGLSGGILEWQLLPEPK